MANAKREKLTLKVSELRKELDSNRMLLRDYKITFTSSAIYLFGVVLPFAILLNNIGLLIVFFCALTVIFSGITELQILFQKRTRSLIDMVENAEFSAPANGEEKSED